MFFGVVDRIFPGKFGAVRKRSHVILRILRTIRDFVRKFGRDPYTRELLRIIKTWGYGHSVLKLCEKLGLVQRYEAPHPHNDKIMCKYNTLTSRGYMLLAAAELDDDDDDSTTAEDDEPP